MTCIVGVEGEAGLVWLGADSFVGCDDHADELATCKIVKLGETLWGLSGSLRFAQILTHGTELPDPDPAMTDDAYIFACIEALRCALGRRGYLNEHGEGGWGGEALLAYRGKLWRVQPDFSFYRSQRGFASVGAGQAAALGALAALKQIESSPRELVVKADATVGGVLAVEAKVLAARVAVVLVEVGQVVEVWVVVV